MGRRRIGFVLSVCALGAACYVGGADDPLPPAARRDAGDAGLGFPALDAGSGFDGQVQSSSTQPVFGPTMIASAPPPPISGGTLLVTRDGARAIAADPDRDAVYVVDLASRAVTATVALARGDEPGRLAEDGAGRVHVALRGAGALVTIDETTGAVLARRAVCPAPRGVAWDSSSDVVWIACATGELVALPAAGGPATASLVVERDLRDVVAASGSLAISEFRSARVLRVSHDGAVVRRDQLPAPAAGFDPQVVWRTVAGASGDLVTVHQMESSVFVAAKPGGYGGGCGNNTIEPPPPSNMPLPADAATNTMCGPDDVDAGCLANGEAVVRGVLTVVAPNGVIRLNRAIPAAVPVDVAVSRDGTAIAAVAAGNAFTPDLGTVLTFDAACGELREAPRRVGATSITPIAVAFDAQNDVLVQTREPATLVRFDAETGEPTTIALSAVSRADTGVDIFHTQAGAMVACASCHPEGGDDGHVWMLDGNPRRTPSLRGTIAGTAPYHWTGSEQNLDTLVTDVYTLRMSGAFLAGDRMSALTGWVQSIPAPPSPSWLDASAVARGQAVFARQDVGCATCHAGPKLTNDTTVDVGTGGNFQVPPLVGVGWRAPLLHDGCAATMADRFGKCATPGHGSTAGLSAGDLADLSTYLESL